MLEMVAGSCHLWTHALIGASNPSRNEDVLKRLQALRDEKGWKIGLSLSGVGQSKTLTKALQTGDSDDGAVLQ